MHLTISRLFVASFLLLTFSLVTFSPLASAGTYKKFYCGCDPKIGTGLDPAYPKAYCNYCACAKAGSYTLGHLETKEFRGFCTGTVEGGPWSGDEAEAADNGLHVHGRRSATTCTIESHVFETYISQSCTNWSVTHDDGVTIEVKCWAYYDQCDDG